MPETREQFERKLKEGVARAIATASSAKELTDAVKAGTDLFKVLYPTDGGEDTVGSGLPVRGVNGHVG